MKIGVKLKKIIKCSAFKPIISIKHLEDNKNCLNLRAYKIV